MTDAAQLLMPYRPDHPVLRPPARSQAQRIINERGVEVFNALMAKRNRAIQLEEENPLEFGYELIIWRLCDLTWGWITWEQFESDPKVPQEWKIQEVRDLCRDMGTFILIMGGNRAAKTYYMLKRLVQCAISKPKALIWCFHQNNNLSVDQHQYLVWEFLPVDWKEAGKGRVAYVSWTRKNGFSDNRLVGPNGTVIEFRNYEQDPKTIEGPELGAPDRSRCIGYVGDELMPLEFLETLRFRLVTRAATGLLGFTAIDGWTPAVGHALDGATTVLERLAVYLDKPKLTPVLQRGHNKSRRVVYFHSEWNPYGNFSGLIDECRNDPDPVKLVRMYGYPHKAREVAFPKFSDRVHVRKLEEFPEDLTWYMICDPGGSKRKNMSMAWIGVDVYERLWVRREWPCPRYRISGYGFPAPWAKPGRGKGHVYDGIPDEGQKTLGFDLLDYKEEIATIEGWADVETGKDRREWEDGGAELPVLVRYIDSRFASTGAYTAAGNTTLLEEFADVGLYFEPTSGSNSSGLISDGVDLINNALGYREGWEAPHDGPSLFFEERCENMIFAMKTWTGQDGNRGATKDWIDCYDGQTEVLTDQGWKRFSNLGGSERVATQDSDGYLEWQTPTEYICQDYTGEMISCNARGCDFMVTPNHRMIVYPQRPQQKIRLATDLKRQDTIPGITKGLRAGGFSLFDEDWFEFLGWYLGNGCATGNSGGKIQTPGRGYSVYISQSRDMNPDRCARIEWLLNRLGHRWGYRNQSYVVSSKALWEEVIGLGNCYTKRVPEYAFSAPAGHIRRLIDGMFASDGWKTGRGQRIYSSVSPRLTSDLQALCQIAGVACGSIITRADARESEINGQAVCSNLPQYWLGTTAGRPYSLTNNHKEMLVKRVPYSGKVYCVSVPNQTLIVRRNGKAMVCGNCLRYALMAKISHVGEVTKQEHRRRYESKRRHFEKR